MNMEFDPTRLDMEEYPLLVNGRVRNGVVEPIYAPDNITDQLPIGVTKIQGIYAAGIYILVFADGLAFYKNVELDAPFVQIADFAMSPDVERIYVALLPASTINFKRSAGDSANAPITLTSTIGSSPQAVICQDGINQPFIITPDGNARVTQNYEQWAPDNREYVPIGTICVHSSGVLYIVKDNLIYRSVTGRPLDFMVIVDGDGNKLPTEAEGGAFQVSHSVGYNNITAMHKLPINDGSLLVTTLTSSHMVVPSFDITLFGEPTFSNVDLFATGSPNSFSFADILGDSAFIDLEGIKSFNAVLQSRFEGQNAPFSKRISKLFTVENNDTIVQPPTVCAGEHDNYALFSVSTVYGNAVVVYDTIREVFVGIDIYDGVDMITQFAEIKLSNTRRLFFVTSANQIYEAFASDSLEQVQLFVGEWTSGTPMMEQQSVTLKLVLTDVFQAGTVSAQLFEDRVAGNTLNQSIFNPATRPALPFIVPFGQRTTDEVRNLVYNFQNFAHIAWKIGFLITWNIDAKLSHVLANSSDVTVEQSVEQGAKQRTAVLEDEPSITTFSPVSGPVGTIVSLIGQNMYGVTSVKFGESLECEFSVVNNKIIMVTMPAIATGSGKFTVQKITAIGQSTNEFEITT